MKKFRLPKFKMPQMPKIKLSKKLFLSKKFIISAVIITALAAGAVIGINTMKTNTALATALSNLAEARHYMKHAESSTLRVQFFSGTREEPYSMDGKAGKSVPFAIVNVDPKNNSLKDFNQIDGTLRIGAEQMPIVLARNPYDRNFATDISRLVDVSMEIVVTLFITSTDHPTLTLVNAMDEDAITWKEALREAINCLGNKIQNLKNYEVYIKIVNDTAKESGAFWYVQFITTDGKTFFCVIAPDGAHIG